MKKNNELNDEEYTICKGCLENGIGKCEYHYDVKPVSTEKEILINELKELCSDLPGIFERVYLMESVSSDWCEKIHMLGELEFWGVNHSYVLNDDIFYPLESYMMSDKILSYTFKVFVIMMRHHPTTLKIWKKENLLESGNPDYEIELIDFMDNLHCESISDYPEIVKLAQSRLNNLIKEIEK